MHMIIMEKFHFCVTNTFLTSAVPIKLNIVGVVDNAGDILVGIYINCANKKAHNY